MEIASNDHGPIEGGGGSQAFMWHEVERIKDQNKRKWPIGPSSQSVDAKCIPTIQRGSEHPPHSKQLPLHVHPDLFACKYCRNLEKKKNKPL